ncbi:MAG: non-canonical purine NTP pyrophosphatase [Candidatus Limiplasma sp.]|nr:non-canonical purine NTP pyrophosphatase [Candidatus Limiplasma sp.]
MFQYQTGKSFGEMTEGEKNAVSHRAVAAKEMRRLLDEVL